MTAEEQRTDGYITLKEASERFGYAPDYVGQLIRKGKIEGKQVYANVAWVTTIEAMERYIAEDRGGKKSSPRERTLLERYGEWVATSKGAPALVWSLRAMLAVLIVFAVIVFYFISVSIDRALLRSAQERHKQVSPVKNGIAVPAPQPSLLNHETL